MQLAGGARVAVATEILQLRGLEVEHRDLVVLFRRREVQRVAQAALTVMRSLMRQSSWNEAPWKCARFRIWVLLQVDREGRDLAEQEACQRRTGVRHGRLIGEQAGEGEDTRRRRRLDDVQPLPAQVAAELNHVPTLLPAERIGKLGDAGPEVGRRVGRRSPSARRHRRT